MKRLLTAVIAGAITYKLAKTIRESAEVEFGEQNGLDHDEEPLPMFRIGDEVLIFNPYTQEMHVPEWEVSPEFYEITAVDYDEDEDVFRYQLKNGLPNEWYSEDWLSLPMETTFIRQQEFEEVVVEPTEEMLEVERKILGKAMDDFARQGEIDRLLDRLNEAKTFTEKAEIERELAELTEGKS